MKYHHMRFEFFFLDCGDFSFCSVLYIYKSKNIYTFQYDFHGVILVKRKGEFGLKYMILSFKNQMDVKTNGVSFTRHKFPDYEGYRTYTNNCISSIYKQL
jgi:hypothetical protein